MTDCPDPSPFDMRTAALEAINSCLLPLPHSGYPPNDRFAQMLKDAPITESAYTLNQVLPPCAIEAAACLYPDPPSSRRWSKILEVMILGPDMDLTSRSAQQIRAVFEWLGPQNPQDVQSTIDWLHDTSAKAAQLSALAKSSRLTVESDSCNNPLPSPRCCKAHDLNAALIDAAAEVSNAIGKKPYTVEAPHDVPLFPSGARYPSFRESSSYMEADRTLDEYWAAPVRTKSPSGLHTLAQYTVIMLDKRKDKLESRLQDEILSDQQLW